MAPKRKADPKQPSLEETVEKPVTKVKTKGTKKETKQEGDHDDLVRAKLARKHGNGNFPLCFLLGPTLSYMHLEKSGPEFCCRPCIPEEGEEGRKGSSTQSWEV